MPADITVVVPYHNERATIEYTLEQVGKQTLAPGLAVFVNSSSTDDSSGVVDAWIANNQSRFTTRFQNLNEGTDTPASSKNVGVRHADGEWVAFMDCGQRFDTNWLESQWAFVHASQSDMVSGVVRATGVNWVDRCAVAQTYGYKRLRPCVPTTLVRKSVFDRTGLFVENRRAGYDAAWQGRLAQLGIIRPINEAVVIRYDGPNYASRLNQLLRKTELYSRASVGLQGYSAPAYHLTLFGAALLIAGIIPTVAIPAMSAIYLVGRGWVLPTFKSRGIALFLEHPLEALFGLPIVGLLLDVSKTIGYLRGYLGK